MSMYNNPYDPYGRVYMNQPMAPQAPFLPAIGAQGQQPNSPTVVQVPTIKQIEQVPVQYNSKVLVLVSNDPVIAMRTADSMGITSTDYYRIERFDPEATPNAPEYVTRAEFMQFVNSLRAPAADCHTPEPNKEDKTV